MSNRSKYIQIFINLFNVDKSVLNESFTYEERSDWDSMSHFALITELEESFDLIFETEDILNYQSFDNGIKILENYGISFDE